MFNNFFKTGSCQYCKPNKDKNKKQLLFKSILDEYVCFRDFLRTYFIYKKVNKAISKMSDQQIDVLISSWIGDLKHKQIKMAWEEAKNTHN